MTVQQIHEYIWDKVIDYCDKHTPSYDDHDYTHIEKVNAIIQLREDKKISRDAYNILVVQCACVLCALYSRLSCTDCPLFLREKRTCHSVLSDFHKVRREYDVEAAKRIRDVDVLSGYEPNKEKISVLEEEDYVQD